jgi:hypothetical protein
VVLGQEQKVIEKPDHLKVGLPPFPEIAVSRKILAFDIGDGFPQSQPAVFKLLNLTGIDSLPKGLGIFRGRGKIRFIDHGYSLGRTAGGANRASETAIQVDLRKAVIPHGQGFRWTAVDTGAAGRTKIRIKLRLKTGIKEKAWFWFGQDVLDGRTVPAVAVAQKADAFGYVLAHVNQSGFFSPVQDLPGFLLAHLPSP